MKINGSVARKVLQDMEAEGKIKKVVSHARLQVYSTFDLWGRAKTDDQVSNIFTARTTAAAE